MVITIKEKGTEDFLVCAKDKRFVETYGEGIRCFNTTLFNVLKDVAIWCNVRLDEECLFEID